MEEERTITYTIIVACIIGIIIVGFFVFKYTSFSNGFSELYFENHLELPDKAIVGKEINFAFTVASHEKYPTLYNYTVLFDKEIIENGSFVIAPDKNTTIKVLFAPNNTTLEFEYNFTTKEYSHLVFKDKIDIASDNIILTNNKTIMLPIRFPIAGNENSTIILEIDQNAYSSHTFTYTGRKPYKTVEIGLNNTTITHFGVDIIDYNTTVYNKQGSIEIIHKKIVSRYQYNYKKISVQVIANGTEYEIHFWIMVLEK